jgi:hypothetical protein
VKLDALPTPLGIFLSYFSCWKGSTSLIGQTDKINGIKQEPTNILGTPINVDGL